MVFGEKRDQVLTNQKIEIRAHDESRSMTVTLDPSCYQNYSINILIFCLNFALKDKFTNLCLILIIQNY